MTRKLDVLATEDERAVHGEAVKNGEGTTRAAGGRSEVLARASNTLGTVRRYMATVLRRFPFATNELTESMGYTQLPLFRWTVTPIPRALSFNLHGVSFTIRQPGSMNFSARATSSLGILLAPGSSSRNLYGGELMSLEEQELVESRIEDPPPIPSLERFWL